MDGQSFNDIKMALSDYRYGDTTEQKIHKQFARVKAEEAGVAFNERAT